jgi:transketolase
LSGLVPIVHSFSCFLSTRPNEQIYNNATEGTKIVYVGGLSGVLPAAPGHSHQSIREVSSAGGIPGLVMVAPSCAAEVGPLLDWCLEKHDGPSFLRLASLPTEIRYVLPEGYEPELGHGVVLRDGSDVVLVGAGPTVLAQAYGAAGLLAEDGVSACVVNLPWLNQVDAGWLRSTIAGKRLLVTLDDHYVGGGQGEKVLAALAGSASPIRIVQLGIRKKPPSGRPAEVLDRVGLSSAHIARTVLKALKD